ncbi:unnamed protein product [Pipistrellus nathusii]|uniref:Uncharacterized protein n=1 Tax=Pipistrellus nathusii TaxID=59473 RepID=A0ABN9ZT44_PIPNA
MTLGSSCLKSYQSPPFQFPLETREQENRRKAVCICSVALSFPVAGIPSLVGKCAGGNTGFQETSLSPASGTNEATLPNPPSPSNAALRDDRLKCSHWSLEVQPGPCLSDHLVNSGKWWPTNLFLPHITVPVSGALGRTTEVSGSQATEVLHFCILTLAPFSVYTSSEQRNNKTVSCGWPCA